MNRSWGDIESFFNSMESKCGLRAAILYHLYRYESESIKQYIDSCGQQCVKFLKHFERVKLLGMTTSLGLWQLMASKEKFFEEATNLLKADKSQSIIINNIKNTDGGRLVLHEWVDDERMALILQRLVELDISIVKVIDKDSKLAIDRAVPVNKRAMLSALRLFGKFDIEKGPLLHKSRTACVIQASITNEREEILPRVLKCMNNIDQV